MSHAAWRRVAQEAPPRRDGRAVTVISQTRRRSQVRCAASKPAFGLICPARISASCSVNVSSNFGACGTVGHTRALPNAAAAARCTFGANDLYSAAFSVEFLVGSIPELYVVSNFKPIWLDVAQRTNSQARSFFLEPAEIAQPKPASSAATGCLLPPPTGS